MCCARFTMLDSRDARSVRDRALRDAVIPTVIALTANGLGDPSQA